MCFARGAGAAAGCHHQRHGDVVMLLSGIAAAAPPLIRRTMQRRKASAIFCLTSVPPLPRFSAPPRPSSCDAADVFPGLPSRLLGRGGKRSSSNGTRSLLWVEHHSEGTAVHRKPWMRGSPLQPYLCRLDVSRDLITSHCRSLSFLVSSCDKVGLGTRFRCAAHVSVPLHSNSSFNKIHVIKGYSMGATSRRRCYIAQGCKYGYSVGDCNALSLISR